MANILIMCDRFPNDMASGLYLRVYHLCKELTREHECFFVDLADTRQPSERILALGLRNACSLARPPTEQLSNLRHFRFTDAHYLRRCSRLYFEKTLEMLGNLTSKWEIDLLVIFTRPVAEIAIDIGLPRILDYPDCEILTMRRELANRGYEMSTKQRVKTRLRIVRQAGRDRYLLRNFNQTLTIGEPDRQSLLRTARVRSDKVCVLPNGVSAEALQVGSGPRIRDRSVVFWGNLDFPPNWTAVRYFYENVFRPYLAESSITFWLVGRGGGEVINNIGKDPNVRMAGYCENLFPFVANKGVMVNPMVEGSGLKNKVLEAFACMIPVVSTRLGIEALPVKHGQECFVTDEPEAFATFVLEILDNPDIADSVTRSARALVEKQFTWNVIGDKLRQTVNAHLTSGMSQVDQEPTCGN